MFVLSQQLSCQCIFRCLNRNLSCMPIRETLSQTLTLKHIFCSHSCLTQQLTWQYLYNHSCKVTRVFSIDLKMCSTSLFYVLNTLKEFHQFCFFKYSEQSFLRLLKMLSNYVFFKYLHVICKKGRTFLKGEKKKGRIIWQFISRAE